MEVTMLTHDEQVRLALIYEPLLFLHRDEKFEPISPDRYMTNSAMWCNQPVEGVRESWGDCGHSVDDDFPRDPLIAMGELSVNAIDLGQPGRTFIGEQGEDGFRPYQVSNEERQLFIQQLSWSIGGADQQFFGAENFREAEPFSDEMPSYFVDVRDQDSVATIPRDPATPLPPGFENAFRSLYPTGFWLITFRFFFAFHEEQLTDCEIDSEVIRAKRADEFFSENLHGSYEGDWHALTLLVRNPGTPSQPGDSSTPLPPRPISPLDLEDGAFPRPEFVGYSRRARGVLVDIGSGVVDNRSYTFMEVASTAAGEAQFTGNHPQAFVARGTHNLYASPGTKTAPKFDSGNLPLPVELIDTCLLADNFDYVFKEVEEIREKVGNAIDKTKRTGIAVAKILGGAIFGGIVGAWAGAIAAALEGVLDPGPDSIPGQPDPAPGPNNVPDVGPSQNVDDDQPNFGTVAVPAALVEEVTATLGDEVVAVKAWDGPITERVIDRTDGVQPWWEPDGNHPAGYQGLWGARVERDPFDRRSGTRIPAFEANFLNAVLTDQG
jgi:hypothetical protein